jgi:hypothetical protein
MNSIEQYCNNKTIAIIGNSSKILSNKSGKAIDDHDIVVRINHAPKYMKSYPDSVGTKTTIMSYGLSRLDLAKQISGICNPLYNLFLIRCNGEIKDYSVYHDFKNPVHGTIDEYKELKLKFAHFKPSTGSVTINYFIKNINFSKLDLYGFDFFKSASKLSKNEFGSYHYKDHDDQLERTYINSILNDKVVINY